MMVTFVSQCEKKSLNKTRRVLDAFANRIGDRTWQTVITNEGLNAVKKLLRKTASKNTAVSCHWIRSRSRSELIWVVGKRDKFNEQGIVPVNYTDQEKFIGENWVDIKNYYANTKKQRLDQHLFAVGCVASLIIKHFVDDDKLAMVTFISGCLHDIGKIDPAFQTWILDETKKELIEEQSDDGEHIDKTGKFSFENHPRHNEISLLLYHLMNDDAYKKINLKNKDRIKHCLYWHHAKPIRKPKNEFIKLSNIYKKIEPSIFSSMTATFKQIINSINVISESYFQESSYLINGFLNKADEDKVYGLNKVNLPCYKEYEDDNEYIEQFTNQVKVNAKNNIARTAVITADRLVSSLTREALNEHIEESSLEKLIESQFSHEIGLQQEIQSCLDTFKKPSPIFDDDRNLQQSKAAQELSETENGESAVKVLSGAAGCGKTKVALEWALNTHAKKIIWICPRVQICQGLVNDLTDPNYLPDTKIEINTGEFKSIYQFGKEVPTSDGEEFSGNVVITTIDQVINAIITHKSITNLLHYMNANVVFDEYHEYISMPAFNLLFAELVECKKLQEDKAKALLVSATPNYYFVKNTLGINQNNIVNIESFNQSRYKAEFINFDESKVDDNPLYQSQPKNTFVVSNTAITAQLSFIKNQQNENAILFHSKFKKTHKKELFENVFNNFKQGGSQEFDVLRAGPIVQASLNITSDKMISEFTHAENWLQRLGRLDRFGKNEQVNYYITAVPETIANKGKQVGACARFLNQLHSFQSAKAWREFLLNKLPKEPVSLAQIYQIYTDFYQDESCCDAVKQDLIDALKKSAQFLNYKLMDPISFPSRKKQTKNKVKISKNSLRGDSRFVQMAIIKINHDENIKFTNQYICDEKDLEDIMTLATSDIEGGAEFHKKSDKDLLAFMYQKDHKIQSIKQGKKITQAYSDYIVRNKAREPDSPIYVSYTQDDLDLTNDTKHPYAIYYALGNKQAIGAISINKLNEKED